MLFKGLFIAVFLLMLALLDGFVLSCLWGWYIVPIGFKPIGLLHAFGLGIFLGYATRKAPKDTGVDSTTPGVDLLQAVVIRPGLCLVAGWLGKGFVVYG